MANFIFSERAGPSLDEVLVGATAAAPAGAGVFRLNNMATGYSIDFTGIDFGSDQVTGRPNAGTITQITVFSGTGDTREPVYNVTNLNVNYASLAAFWAVYLQSGSAAAFGRLLTGQDVINGSAANDRIGVYGLNDVIYGANGNDTFLVYAGVKDAAISGTNRDGDEFTRQTDVVDLRGSASFRSLAAIDVLSFASSNAAKTVTYNANSPFGVSQVRGSNAGADTILFTTGSQPADLDLRKTTFTSWGRENQTILVKLNTDTTVALDDRFVGSAAGERVTAGKGRDLLYGNKGNDYLDGGDEIDVLDGGDGNDTLIGGGGEGPNILKGGNGNDVYKFKDKVDIIIDSGGLDSRVVAKTTTLSTSGMFEGLAADEALSPKASVNLTGTDKANVLIGHSGKNTLNGRGGNDIIEGRAGSDQLNGGAGNDNLSDGDGNDKLNGEAGNDKLSGGRGNDSLAGGDGTDRLVGGLGTDLLNGGAGKDTFVFDMALSASNIDKISGFSVKDDTIALEKSIFTTLVGSTLASSAFYVGAKAHDANDRIVYNKSTGALYYDADGIGRTSALTKFAQLDKNLKLGASDFILI